MKTHQNIIFLHFIGLLKLLVSLVIVILGYSDKTLINESLKLLVVTFGLFQFEGSFG